MAMASVSDGMFGARRPSLQIMVHCTRNHDPSEAVLVPCLRQSIQREPCFNAKNLNIFLPYCQTWLVVTALRVTKITCGWLIAVTMTSWWMPSTCMNYLRFCIRFCSRPIGLSHRHIQLAERMPSDRAVAEGIITNCVFWSGHACSVERHMYCSRYYRWSRLVAIKCPAALMAAGSRRALGNFAAKTVCTLKHVLMDQCWGRCQGLATSGAWGIPHMTCSSESATGLSFSLLQRRTPSASSLVLKDAHTSK